MFPYARLLVKRNGALRADACASSALYAEVRIDVVDIALGDGTGRALRLACAASDTKIWINFVSHNYSY